MLLDDATEDVKTDISTQREIGIQITAQNEVPDTGPTNKGVWYKIDDVTAVFADMKRSTQLNVSTSTKFSARSYTYFIRSMVRIGDRFGAKYMDIQGDGLFALFSGKDSVFHAFACAETMRTLTQTEAAKQLKKDSPHEDWTLAASIGLDRNTVLVRRLGLRSEKENEVWAGKPVSMAAGLAALGNDNELIVSDRVYSVFEDASKLRRRAILWSCGCAGGEAGPGLDADEGQTRELWVREDAPPDAAFDFDSIHRLEAAWCRTHGAEFCQTIVDGKRPSD